MSRPPTLPGAALLAAWRKSEYRVETTGGRLVLRVDEHSPGLEALMQAEAVDCAAYITADNPFSRIAGDTENAGARLRLQARLSTGGWRWLSGLGIDPGGDHPGEYSLLVLGISLADASSVAREFEQHAILTIASDAIPRLLVL